MPKSVKVEISRRNRDINVKNGKLFVPSGGGVPENNVFTRVGESNKAVARTQDFDTAAVVDGVIEFYGGAEGVEIDPGEVVVSEENGGEVGVGLLGVIEVELDEIRAVDEGAPRLRDAPVAQEIFHGYSAENVHDYLARKFVRHCRSL